MLGATRPSRPGRIGRAPARAAVETLGDAVEPRWVAAALLHDVGKAETTFGVIRRSLATVVATGAGPRRARAIPGAIGRYVNHDELGAQRLRAAGARPEAVAWAAVHHRRDALARLRHSRRDLRGAGRGGWRTEPGLNSGRKRADTRNVRQPTDSSYFVRIGGEPYAGHGPDNRAIDGRTGLGSAGPVTKRRRRRGMHGRAILILLVVAGLGSWTYWASQRPGGVSGTVHGWIDDVRGKVDSVSTDPDLATARRYFNGQYAGSNAYPQMTEADLAAAGIGVGVNVEWCNSQAVVIQGASGGGTVSRLLVSGHDLGELKGKYDCPADLTKPLPWKRA